MSGGVVPSRIARARELLSTESSLGAVSGDDIDWDTGPLGSSADQWKQPVRCATTGAITIATGLNAGDVIDGVTLAAGDRVLVKDMGGGGVANGIYVAGAVPERAPDFDEDDEVRGAIVYVVAGTANGGTTWRVTNTAATIVDTDGIAWAAFGGGGGDTSGELGAGFDGGLSVLAAGKVQDVRVPFTRTLTGWDVLAQQTGSATFGVAKASYAAFPTFTDMIGAGAVPTLTGADKNSGSVAAWTTVAVTAGDILRITLLTVSTIQQVVVVLPYSRP